MSTLLLAFESMLLHRSLRLDSLRLLALTKLSIRLVAVLQGQMCPMLVSAQMFLTLPEESAETMLAVILALIRCPRQVNAALRDSAGRQLSVRLLSPLVKIRVVVPPLFMVSGP